MNDYKITIRSIVDGQTSEVIAFGDVSDENGTKTIGYFDGDTGSNMRVIIGGGIVSIVREGEMDTVLTFEKGKTYDADIRTEYGIIPFLVKTSDVKYEGGEENFQLKLDYYSDLGGEFNRFDVTIGAEKIR